MDNNPLRVQWINWLQVIWSAYLQVKKTKYFEQELTQRRFDLVMYYIAGLRQAQYNDSLHWIASRHIYIELHVAIMKCVRWDDEQITT